MVIMNRISKIVERQNEERIKEKLNLRHATELVRYAVYWEKSCNTANFDDK